MYRRLLAAAIAFASTGALLSGSPLGTGALADDGDYVVAAGDIACNKIEIRDSTHCHEDATAALFRSGGPLAGAGLKAVLPLGDLQYPKGQYTKFVYKNEPACSTATGPCSFKASWVAAAGSVPIMPTPGNHEYMNPSTLDTPCTLQGVTATGTAYNACGYNRYFTDAVAAPTTNGDGKGNYFFRFDAGAAHPILFVALNVGECQKNKPACSDTGSVVSFLKATLASATLNPDDGCTVVYWHQARWSYFDHGNVSFVGPVWQGLFNFGGTSAQRPDLVLNGHDHDYQRFAPLDTTGHPGTANPSIPEIIVGSGGDDLSATVASNALVVPGPPAASDTSAFGVLKLSWSSTAGTLTASLFPEGATAPTDTQAYACNVAPPPPAA